MLQHLLKLCIERRFAALAITLMIAAYGVLAYLRTPVEAYPDVTNVQVEVVAQVPGLAPEEMEKQVTIPLERALNGNPGMKQMRSESGFGLTIIWCVFEDGVDSFEARTRTAERLLTAEVPEHAFVRLTPDATPLGKIFYYRVTSDRHDLYELRATQEFTIARVLKQVPGVADAQGMGGFLKEFHLEIDPNRLYAYGLTLHDVSTAVAASNLNVGGGFQNRGDQQLTIRGIGYLTSAQDIKDIVLAIEGGTPVTVGDVSRVVQAHTPRQGAVGFNEEREIVEGIVLLRRGENPEEVLDGIHHKIDELNASILPDGMRIETMYDRSILTGFTLATVNKNLLHGFLLIVGVVWLFLRSLRGSLIVASVIPLALLTAFIGLHAIDLPANLISMGAIDFGILVDGAVVLVESAIHEGRRERPTTQREMLRLVGRSALRVARPTFYAMAVIIAALIPVFTLESVEGRIFRPLALTYSFALLGALVFSLTVVPALCAIFLRPKDVQKPDPVALTKLRDAYAASIDRVVRRRPSIGLWLGVLLAGLGAVIAPRLGTEFLPELDEGDVFVVVEMPPSISLERGQDVLAEVRRKLLEFPEVWSTPSEQGRPEDGLDNETINMSETFARLRPRDQWRPGYDTERLVAEMRMSLSEIPGVKFNFSQPIKDRVEEAVSGVRGKVVLKAFGLDIKAMRETLLAAKDELESVEGIVDLGLYRDATVPQLQIRLDRPALARAGITVDDAAEVIETAMAGKVATTMWENERLIPVRVRLPVSEKVDATRIGNLMVPTEAGGRVPLRELADIELADGRISIMREGNSRYVALKFNVEGRDLGSVVDEGIAKVEQAVEVPEGTYLSWGGEFENQQRAMKRLQIIVPLALLLVFLLLYGALSSGRSAATVLVSAPFAMTGGLFGLYASGVALSVSAAVGFIALLGQVSLAGLLVISAIDDERRAGKDLDDAIVAGSTTRFRAILMTALLAMLGLLPMAISEGMGSETQKPFALVIVCGMVTTLVVALYVVPVLYRLIAAKQLSRPEDISIDIDVPPSSGVHT